MRRHDDHVVFQAFDTLLEFGDAFAEVTAHVGKAFAEKQHADDHDDHDFHRPQTHKCEERCHFYLTWLMYFLCGFLSHVVFQTLHTLFEFGDVFAEITAHVRDAFANRNHADRQDNHNVERT